MLTEPLMIDSLDIPVDFCQDVGSKLGIRTGLIPLT